MDLIGFLKLFGAGFVERELAAALKKHVTSAGYADLATKFQAGATGCNDKSPDEVAQAISDLLFSIH